MTRIKIVKKIEKESIEYQEKTIEITPVLSLTEQVFLINNYIKDYFYKTEISLIEEHQYNFIEAEYNLIANIYYILTNIDVSRTKKTGLNDVINDIVLWKQVSEKIENYMDFRKKLDIIISDIKNKKSLSVMLSNFVEKALSFVENAGDISPELLIESQKSLEGLVQKIEESSVLKKINEDLEKEKAE